MNMNTHIKHLDTKKEVNVEGNDRWRQASLELLWSQYHYPRSLAEKCQAQQWLIKMGEL